MYYTTKLALLLLNVCLSCNYYFYGFSVLQGLSIRSRKTMTGVLRFHTTKTKTGLRS